MTGTIHSFEQQKMQAMEVLSRLATFVMEGRELGIDLPKEIDQKLKQSLATASDQKLRVALIGGFSEGKTSIAAAWLEELDRKSMNISQKESTSEVSIYNFKDQLQIIDTPGLFGFKEKIDATAEKVEKYKDITKRYVSEAHLVLYVMNPTNPIKESHTEELKWLFRTLNLLPRTVFVLSRFDEVADVNDPDEFQDNFRVKRNSVLERLKDVLELNPEEASDITIVAVSANPFDMGVEHWLRHIADFRRISRIGELQAATQEKIERNGGLLSLAYEAKKSVISDVITKQLPAAKEAFGILEEEDRRFREIEQSQTHELNRIHHNITQAKVRLRGRLLRYFEDLQLQAGKTSLNTFNDFLHREIGNEGCLVQQRIQEIFSDEVGSISSDLRRVQVNVDNEILHYNDMVISLGKKGVKFLSQPGMITNSSVLAARNGLSAATKMVGIDIGSYLKFKPWGATKLANGLGSALAIVGIALEAWDSYKEQERRAKFEEAIRTMTKNLQEQSKEVTGLVDAPNFADQFFPAFTSLKEQLAAIDAEMGVLRDRRKRFNKWYENGAAIDAEFREISDSAHVHWDSLTEIAVNSPPASETMMASPPLTLGQAPNVRSSPTSFWSRWFS